MGGGSAVLTTGVKSRCTCHADFVVFGVSGASGVSGVSGMLKGLTTMGSRWDTLLWAETFLIIAFGVPD